MLPTQNNRHLPAQQPLYFDDFITRDRWNAAQRQLPVQLSLMPAINVYETVDTFFLELVVPGVAMDDLQFFTTDRSIEVRYEPDASLFEPFGHRRVWSTGYRPAAFRRLFELNPEALDFDELRVSEYHGIIRFEIPKRPAFRGLVMPVTPFSLN